MGALELDKLTWPEVQSELEAGRDTVVIALGATEQHGRHMPLATDALLGDELARAVADRIDAFLAPTVRVVCSEHHLDFPGTLSVEEETFHLIVRELVKMDRAGAGFTGDLQEAIQRMFAGGTKAVAENGAIGGPARASAEH